MRVAKRNTASSSRIVPTLTTRITRITAIATAIMTTITRIVHKDAPCG